jgi:hypothetical protein
MRPRGMLPRKGEATLSRQGVLSMRSTHFCLHLLFTPFILLCAPACDTTTTCGDELECDGATEYCAITKDDNGGQPVQVYSCEKKPQGCDSCACLDIETDLQVMCSGGTSCESIGDFLKKKCALN